MIVLEPQLEMLEHVQTREIIGAVASIRGLSVLVDDLPLPVGALVRVHPQRAAGPVHGEVIGFDGPRSVVMLFGAPAGVTPGTAVVGEQTAQIAFVGETMLGRVVDGLGRPIDGGTPLHDMSVRPLHPPPASALRRRRIVEPLPTGVRAIDGLLTLGKGQRVGVFAGPGVGKSTLLASVARHTTADVNVIALVGERGREVRDFLESALGETGLARSVVVVATGDESPLLRLRAALLACTVAEFFRDAGRDVMLMMDSVTRLAQAQRQIGLSVGEQPATKGYTPSVFAMLPTILERAGAIEGAGSVTGLYTILVEGDDLTEPIADAARGTLDGHLVLSRRLASRGHYPAIDPLDSLSRIADAVCDRNHIHARRRLLTLLAAYAEAEELINIGAYAEGSNPHCDVARRLRPQTEAYLCQEPDEHAAYPQTCRDLITIAAEADKQLQAATATAGRQRPAEARQP